MHLQIIKLAISTAMLFCLCGLSQAQFRPPQPSANDPVLFRPPGTSLQQAQQNRDNAPPTLQADGQRVFNQPPIDKTSVQALDRGTISPTKSAVQPASWTTESDITATKSKSRVPLEFKASSKETSSGIEKSKSTWGAALSMFFSLAIVISFFLLGVWLIKKSQPHSFVKLPGDVVQVMGRTPMAPRQQMYVVRFGSKLLLISHQAGQTQTLGEITDEDEVQRLAGLCEANQPGSISNSFRDVLKQVTLGKPEPRPSGTFAAMPAASRKR